jgi:hypothetical protein
MSEYVLALAETSNNHCDRLDPTLRKDDVALRRMESSGRLRRVAFVRTDVSEDLTAFFIRVARIGELGTTLAVTSNRRSVASYS